MNSVHSQTVSLIWNIADDVLRDIFVRGQYRDVILPMVVLRRLDALLESTKVAVEEEMKLEKENGFDDLDEHAIKNITGLSYYNTSRWTLARLKQQATGDNDILYDNFAEYLNGFSKNVSDVLTKFEFFAKARKLADRDCLLPLIEKITDPFINLTDQPVKDPNGLTLPAVSNIDMGTIFEELLRRFNEENNEEAGEHFTPRDVIHLLSQMVFEPVLDDLPQIIQIYDPACGSGGMLTEASDYLISRGVAQDAIEISGTEINPEADPVISKRIKRTAADYKTLVDLFGVDPEDLADYGLYADGKEYIIYESDSNLRDTEKIPVSDDIYEYFKREVKPYADDAWINLPQTKIGCEISFTKYFYEPKPLRTLAENESDIVTLDRESQEILRSILNIVG